MERAVAAAASYCGAAPLPEELLLRWNLDPVLLCVLAALALAGSRLPPGPRRKALLGGVAALFIAFVSPLCALSSGLFSARSVHHLVIVGIAGPLLGYGLRRPGLPFGALTALHILIFWFWHLPEAYAAALSDALLYWLMQLSLLGSATILWARLLGGELGSTGVAALAALMGQMGLLGALLTFAPEPLYAPHLVTAPIYGLTALEDQQLAGLIMWVLSLPIYALAALPLLSRMASSKEVAT